MTAAMKAAGNRRAPAQVGFLLHRQRIHVRAQTNPLRAVTFAFEQADNTGAAEAAMHLDAPAREFLSDDAGRAMFLEADFRMRVKITADSCQFFGKAVDQFNVGHTSISMNIGNRRCVTPSCQIIAGWPRDRRSNVRARRDYRPRYARSACGSPPPERQGCRGSAGPSLP